MIKQNNEVFDNVFRGNNLIVNPENPFGTPLDVLPTRNIKIIGKNDAKIVGCDINRRSYHSFLKEEQDMVGDFWGWRTHQISLSKCTCFEISGIEFFQTRGWTMSFDFCCDGYIHDLKIVSNVKNGDGVNFRAGCHHCKVDNITGYTSDDTVACTALFKRNRNYPDNKYLYPNEPAKSIFDGDNLRELDIHDISISRVFTGGEHHGVICLASGGLQVYNIDIRDVIEDCFGKREAAVKIYTGYGEGYRENDFHDITVTNVVSSISGSAVMCNAKVNNVILKNIQNKSGVNYNLTYTEGIVIYN
jgi:polygalacturonase